MIKINNIKLYFIKNYIIDQTMFKEFPNNLL